MRRHCKMMMMMMMMIIIIIVSKIPSFAEAKFHVFIHLKFEGEKVDTE